MVEVGATVPSGRQGQGRRPWASQPGENQRWYARFLRYVALGPSRSLSLLTRGRKNAYPVPAHWPAKAAQSSWKDRAQACDRLLKSDPKLIGEFNLLLRDAAEAVTDELLPHEEAILKHGYQAPVDDEEEAQTAVG